MNLKTVREAIAQRSIEQPEPDGEAHWKCPDCGIACYCTGDAQMMLHTRCGRQDGDE